MLHKFSVDNLVVVNPGELWEIKKQIGQAKWRYQGGNDPIITIFEFLCRNYAVQWAMDISHEIFPFCNKILVAININFFYFVKVDLSIFWWDYKFTYFLTDFIQNASLSSVASSWSMSWTRLWKSTLNSLLCIQNFHFILNLNSNIQPGFLRHLSRKLILEWRSIELMMIFMWIRY